MSARKFPVVPVLVGAWIAVAVFALVPSSNVPRSLISVFAGERVRTVDILGGADAKVRVLDSDPAAAREVARRLGAGLGDDDPRVDGDVVEVAAVEADPDQLEQGLWQMSAGGTLEFKIVVADSPFMRDMAREVQVDPRAAELGVGFEVDLWVHDETGRQFRDNFLIADTRAALEDYIAGLSPPAGHELVVEELAWGDFRGKARSYLVDATVELGSADVASADVVYSEFTGRAEVLIEFDDRGALAFERLTEANAGNKLAILLGGRVSSAPVIQTAIRGGRSSITMGASDDPRQVEADANALVASLRAGSLPASIEVLSVAPHPATVGGGTLMFARLALALLCALVGFGATYAVRRWLLPGRSADPIAATPSGSGRLPWGRLAVTIAAPVFVLLGYKWVLPTINRVELDNILSYNPGGGDTASLSVFALGLTPILIGFVLVEIAALAVPGWRRHRHTPTGRLYLAMASLGVGAVLALLQGWVISLWIESVGAGPGGFGGTPLVGIDSGFRTLTMFTLTGGAFCLVVLAWLVTRFGLGNGFSIVLFTAVVGEARQLVSWLREVPPAPMAVLIQIAAIGAVAAGTVFVLRRRVDGKRLPTCGLVPIDWGATAVLIASQLAVFGYFIPFDWMSVLAPGSAKPLIMLVAVALPAAVLMSFLFSRARPQSPATAVSAGFILGIVGVHYLTIRLGSPVYLSPLTVVFATAVLLDVHDEWRARARLGDLVHVCDEHRVQRIDPILTALRDAGIGAHARGVNHRALLHFFGPFIPVSIYAPRDEAGRAHKIAVEATLAADDTAA